MRVGFDPVDLPSWESFHRRGCHTALSVTALQCRVEEFHAKARIVSPVIHTGVFGIVGVATVGVA